MAAGILEYCGLENKGFGQVSGTLSPENGVNSRVYNLRYVEPAKFDEYVNNNDQRALNVFTLDENFNLITATWSYDSNNGVTINKNSPMNYRTQLNRFSMPFEYLIAWLIDVKNEEFVSQLADLAINSEYVIAVQDNVSTTSTVVTEAEKTTLINYVKETNGRGSSYWRQTSRSERDWTADKEVSNLVTENCRTTVEITYADSWCATFSKESSYSLPFLSQSKASGTFLTGKQGDLIGNAKLTGYYDWRNVGLTASGNKPIVGRTVALAPSAVEDIFGIDKNANGGDGLYGLSDEELPKICINGQVYYVDDYGDDGMDAAWTQNKQLWVDIFCATKEDCANVTVADFVTPVYFAENVTNMNASQYVGAASQNVNTVANILGKVNYNSTSSSDTALIDMSTTTGTDMTTSRSIKTQRNVTRRTTTTITTASNTYDSGESMTGGNVEKFVSLYKKNEDKIRNSIKPAWLYRVLEKNSKTVGMIDLTKYLIYKATDRDYGVKTYNFDIYDISKFSNSVGGSVSYESLNITDEDKQILYKIVSAERGGGTQEQQEYVVSVILNRVLSPRFPNTVKDVVFAEGQFEPVSNGAYDAANPSAITIAAVDNVVETGDKSDCAVYFMTPAASLKEKNKKWLANCIYLFNDTDESLKDVNKGGTHNFYTTEEDKQLLSQYIKYANGGTIVQEAVNVHKYLRENGYIYQLKGISVPNLSGRTIDCSSFVTWVLVNAGVQGFSEGMYQWQSSVFTSNPLGWQEVSINEAQAGDIVTYNGHVEIIAANDPNNNKFIVYNCGGDSAIQASGTSDLPESSTSKHQKSTALKILRVPTD